MTAQAWSSPQSESWRLRFCRWRDSSSGAHAAHLNPGGDTRLAPAVRREPLAALDSLSNKDTCKLPRDMCPPHKTATNQDVRSSSVVGKTPEHSQLKKVKCWVRYLKRGGGGRYRTWPAQHTHTRVHTLCIYPHTHSEGATVWTQRPARRHIHSQLSSEQVMFHKTPEHDFVSCQNILWSWGTHASALANMAAMHPTPTFEL